MGTLTDEFLHVWNNHLFQRGRYLEDDAAAAEHRNLAIVFRYSGSANDRRLHQLELANYELPHPVRQPDPRVRLADFYQPHGRKLVRIGGSLVRWLHEKLPERIVV